MPVVLLLTTARAGRRRAEVTLFTRYCDRMEFHSSRTCTLVSADARMRQITVQGVRMHTWCVNSEDGHS